MKATMTACAPELQDAASCFVKTACLRAASASRQTKYSIPGNEQHCGCRRNEPVVIHDTSNTNNRANHHPNWSERIHARSESPCQMRLSSAQSEHREHPHHTHQTRT